MNPVFTAVIVALIVVLSGAIISTNVLENVSQTGDFYSFSNTKNAMNSLYDIIQDISLDIDGSRHFTFSNTNGYLVADNSVRILMDNSAFSESLVKKEDNVLVKTGPLSLAYSQDMDSDTIDDLVLENEAIIFSLKQVGDSDSYASLGDVLAYIKNKQTNAVIDAGSLNIEVDEVMLSSAQGYTELDYHPVAVSNSIHMFATSLDLEDKGISGVDVYFTLSGASDFVEIKVMTREMS